MTWIIISAIFAGAFVYWAHRDTSARMQESRAKEAVAKACGPDPRVITLQQRAQDALDETNRLARRTVSIFERLAGPQKKGGAEILQFERPDDPA